MSAGAHDGERRTFARGQQRADLIVGPGRISRSLCLRFQASQAVFELRDARAPVGKFVCVAGLLVLTVPLRAYVTTSRP